MKETRRILCKLTPAELNERGNLLSQLTIQLLQTKEEKAAIVAQFGATIKALEAKTNLLSVQIQNGSESRDIDCEVKISPDGFSRQVIRLDTGELIATEKLNHGELNLE